MPDLRLEGDPLYRVQGGDFSSLGHLYLTSDLEYEAPKQENPTGGGNWAPAGVHIYSTTDPGKKLGYFDVPYEKDAGSGKELEGILVHDFGSSWGQVHTVVLDNDVIWDDYYIRHYTASNNGIL